MLAVVGVAVGLGAAGCGGSAPSSPAVARIPGESITAATLSHWVEIFAPQHVVPQPPDYTACVARLAKDARNGATGSPISRCREQHQALVRQALDFLIGAAWLTGEAASRGQKVSRDDVARRLRAVKSSFPNGDQEFRESLIATSHTVADLERELEAELSAARLKHGVEAGVPVASEAQAHAYYTTHLGQYEISERRYIYIFENLPSASAARHLISELGQGRSLTDNSLHESFQRREIPEFEGEKRQILEAIFAAPLRRVAKPVELNGYFFVFEVVRIDPGYLQPFASVRDAIAALLTKQSRRAKLERFIAAWRRRWIAKTRCAPGYLIQKCSGYRGRRVAETLESFL